MMRITNITPVLLGLALSGGCGSPAGNQPKEVPQKSSPSAMGNMDGLTLPPQSLPLSSVDVERLEHLAKACNSIDLSKLEYVSGAAKSQIASPSELAARIALCDAFNESQRNAADKSQSAGFRALAAYLVQTAEHTDVSDVISELITINTELEQPSSSLKSAEDPVPELTSLFLKRAKVESDLASRLGIVLTTQGILTPVVATISQSSNGHQLVAYVVRYPESRSILRPIGQTDNGGFILINFLYLCETMATGRSLSGIIANEFDSQRLIINEGFNVGLLSVGSDQLRPVDPPQGLERFSKPYYDRIVTPSAMEIMELSSDVASTTVDPKDVNRIIFNSLEQILALRMTKSLSVNTPPAVKKLVNGTFAVYPHYSLSNQLSFVTLLYCYERDGRLPQGRRILDEAQESANTLEQLYSQISNVARQIDSKIGGAPNREISQLLEEINGLVDKSNEVLLEVRKRNEQIAKNIPDEYLKTISEVLRHYANNYLDQLKQLKN